MTKIQHCRRCGTCCQKGGPALHLEDKPLVESGKIPLKNLFTIRKGEHVFENVRGGVVQAQSDIIKIKPLESTSICNFYEQFKKTCAIYEQRPVECRLLTCWDTNALQAVYDKDRLTRKDLLESVEGLWDLITTHQQKCDYMFLAACATQQTVDSDRQILEMIRYDMALRDLLIKQGQQEALLDFLLGRPMMQNLKGFYLATRIENGKLALEHLPRPQACDRDGSGVCDIGKL